MNESRTEKEDAKDQISGNTIGVQGEAQEKKPVKILKYRRSLTLLESSFIVSIEFLLIIFTHGEN